MRSFITIFFTLIVLNDCYAQSVINKTDTFTYAIPLSYQEIIVRSDSTFLQLNVGCHGSRLTLGTWQPVSDKLLFTFFYNNDIEIRTDSYNIEEEDTVVNFIVKDWKGNPIGDLGITLTDNYKADSFLSTNEQGVVSLKRNAYSGYYLDIEERELNYDRSSNDITRFLSNRTKTIFITFLKPVPGIDPATNELNCSTDQFILEGQALRRINSTVIYSKDRKGWQIIRAARQ